jgi:hypothetical protein
MYMLLQSRHDTEVKGFTMFGAAASCSPCSDAEPSSLSAAAKDAGETLSDVPDGWRVSVFSQEMAAFAALGRN